ncbi:MAG: glycosyltransferase family 2 protein [Ginsengibacter sp.]
MFRKVDIIIINWNSGKQTMDAVAPYLNYKSANIFCNVIVVDNASDDDSSKLFEGRINKLIFNNKNEGFGKACNQAFAQSNSDYILLLNPDTLSHPSVLENLVEFLEKNPEYAVTGPQQRDRAGQVLKTCCRFPNFKRSLFEILGLSKVFPKIFTSFLIMTDWDHLQNRNVDHIMGSYMLIRKSVIDDIGFMDVDYFVYLEDVDLSKRINNAGFKSYYNSKYFIYHEGGGTGKKSEALRLFYSLSSRRTYWKKHLGEPKAFVLTSISLLTEPFLRVVDSIIKERKFGLKKIGKAYYWYIKKILNHGKLLN